MPVCVERVTRKYTRPEAPLDLVWTHCLLTPHLQGAFQIGLEPLPVVRHRPLAAPPWRMLWTLGCSPIQVGPPAVGLWCLQETVGAQARKRLVWKQRRSQPPLPHLERGPARLHFAQSPSQVLCPTEAWPRLRGSCHSAKQESGRRLGWRGLDTSSTATGSKSELRGPPPAWPTVRLRVRYSR